MFFFSHINDYFKCSPAYKDRWNNLSDDDKSSLIHFAEYTIDELEPDFIGVRYSDTQIHACPRKAKYDDTDEVKEILQDYKLHIIQYSTAICLVCKDYFNIYKDDLKTKDDIAKLKEQDLKIFKAGSLEMEFNVNAKKTLSDNAKIYLKRYLKPANIIGTWDRG